MSAVYFLLNEFREEILVKKGCEAMSWCYYETLHVLYLFCTKSIPYICSERTNYSWAHFSSGFKYLSEKSETLTETVRYGQTGKIADILGHCGTLVNQYQTIRVCLSTCDGYRCRKMPRRKLSLLSITSTPSPARSSVAHRGCIPGDIKNPGRLVYFML